VGCYTDTVSNRALAVNVIPNGATVESCTAACGAANFLYAGLEYFGQCFCDDILNDSAPVDASFCNTPCSADESETCGGAPYLSVYTGDYEPGCEQPDTCSFSAAGCYLNTPDHVIPINPDTVGSLPSGDISCWDSCDQAGFNYGAYDSSNSICYCALTLDAADAFSGTCTDDGSLLFYSLECS